MSFKKKKTLKTFSQEEETAIFEKPWEIQKILVFLEKTKATKMVSNFYYGTKTKNQPAFHFQEQTQIPRDTIYTPLNYVFAPMRQIQAIKS